MFAEKHMETFFGGIIKNLLHDLCDQFIGKNLRKKFSGKFGEIRAKILRIPKISLLLHLCLIYTQMRKML